MSGTGNANVSGDARVYGPVVGLNQGQITTTYNITKVYQYVSPQPVEEGILTVARARMAALPLDRIPDPAPLPPGSRMPLARNPLFVGREQELRALARALYGEPSIAAISAAAPPLPEWEQGSGGEGRIAAATGLGGLGKTQLAAEFVHRFGQFFAGGVFWLSFSDPNGIPAEVAACGQLGLIERPDFAEIKLDDQVRLVLAAWQSALPRLLIFDNCEDDTLLAGWRPTTGGCRVLVTSRRMQWEPSLGLTALPLDVLSRAESVALLRTFRPDLPADDPALAAIGADLGDLPLALHLAGSFLARYRHAVTPSDYRQQLGSPALLQHRSLRDVVGFSPTGHVLDIGRTFALSYERLDAADLIDASALKLLARAAYLALGVPIPRSLLITSLGLSPDDPDAPLQAEDALGRLIDLGLLETEAEGTLRLHRLINVYVRATSTDSVAQAAAESALLNAFRQFNTSGNLVEARQLEPHLRAVTDQAIPRADERTVDLCHILGNHLSASEDYAGAQRYLEQALTIHEALLGKDHPQTALDLNDLGYVIHYRGDYARARSHLERALPLWEQLQDYPNLAATFDNLGQLLNKQGNSAGAQEYYRRALAIRERVLGADHPLTAITLHNLGQSLMAQGDLPGALEHFKRSLAIREQVYKEPNQHTAASLNSLGQLLQQQGDLAGARDCYERALAIREQVLGPTHPRTFNTRISLATVLDAQGDLIGAQAYMDRVLPAREQLQESNATSINNLGYALWVRGEYARAQRYYEDALAIYERIRGNAHPDLVITLNNLGMVHVSQGNYAAAREYYERALRIQQQSGAEGELLIARILNNFGVLLCIQGELGRARSYLERALAIRQEALGETHRDTATTLNNLGLLLQAEGDLAGARQYIERALIICEQLLSGGHPDIARSLNDLGVVRQAQGQLSQARTCLERALAIREQVLPGNHPDTAATLANLGTLAHVQGNLAEARTLLERALVMCQQRLSADHPTIRAIRDRLTVLDVPPQHRS